MKTLLQFLRLMRFPLVFTAIGDAWAVRMLGGDSAGWSLPPAGDLAILAGVSFGLYGLGMVLNDVVDAKADAAGSPGRPIPSGAIPRWAGAALAGLLAAGALGLAAWRGHDTLVVASAAGVLILAYDLALKRLPIAGLLTLGLIRAVHCQISGVGLGPDEPAGGAQLAGWVSVFLFTHVAVVSWIAWEWEHKRPRMGTAGHWLLAFAIVGLDVLVISYLTDLAPAELPGLRLTLPLLTGLGYMLAVVWVLGSRRFNSSAERGQMAMRLGLMWLLAYDAAFLLSAGRWAGAAAMGVLFALMLASSRGMIFWSMRTGVLTPHGLTRSTMKGDTSDDDTPAES